MGGDRDRLAGERGCIHVGASIDDDAVAGHELAWPEQQRVADRHGVRVNILDATRERAVRMARGRGFEVTHGGRRATFRIPLERFTPRLHHDDHQTGQRLAQHDRGNDRRGGDEIGGEAPVSSRDQHFPYDRRPEHHQRR